MENKKRGAPKGNKNSQKGAEVAGANLNMRCTKTDKEKWVLAAHSDGKKLSEWVIHKLNN